MATATTLRLPGVSFLPVPRVAGATLPPLDVAAFVGFAERGPLDLPVALDELADFRAIFGGDLALARKANGEPLTAHLADSVAAFFSNGGRRCYVVRIAGAAANRARWQVPGLVRVDAQGQTTPVEIEASSEGRWPENVRLAARLAEKFLPASAFSELQRGRNAETLESEFTLLWDTGGVAAVLQPGDVVRLNVSFTEAGVQTKAALLFLLSDVRGVAGQGANLRRLAGSRLWQLVFADPTDQQPTSLLPLKELPGGVTMESVARLRFDLVLRETGAPQITVSDLAFSGPHSRFWGDVALLESSPLFRTNGTQRQDALFAAERYRERQQPQQDLQIAAVAPGTVELSGRLAPVEEERRGDVYLPWKMVSILGEADFVSRVGTPDQDPLTVPGQDDLDTYPIERYLDEWLAAGSDTATGLYENAQDRVYIQRRRLRGMHSLMFCSEVALIALPDSVHPFWLREVPVVVPIPPPPVAVPPDLSRFDPCPKPPSGELKKPKPVATAPPQAPLLPLILEDALFGTAERPATVDPLESLKESLFVRVQAELQKLCEARRDAMGILNLPQFYERRHCLTWQQALRLRLGLPAEPSVFDDTNGLPDLSYMAVYHPWVQIVDALSANHLRAVPSDGGICGTIAARERARGVWIAPANIALSGVLALTPSIPENDRADLFAAGFNILHAEPRDFRAMSAHTLSAERIWLQISVRRLLIVLRKMALERGNDYVFENNSPHFREAVRLSLDSVLRELFVNGAFAGRTRDLAYRITTDASVNTPQTMDAGQFIVEIRVAPSQPAEFITVRLVRTGDNLLATTER